MKNLTDDPRWPFEPEKEEHDYADEFDFNYSQIKIDNDNQD